ncbi:MAG: DUF3078 domain-containing protein [Bacteroidetes bacterium]|nr:DUF3078 domain-containing protein [Bacteroidota bacterium]
MILTGLYLLIASVAYSQGNCSPDSLSSGKKPRFKHELEYSIALSSYLYMKWHHDKSAGNVILLQKLNYKFCFSRDSLVKFSGSLVHDLGIQSYFDSITKVHTDDNTLNTRFEIRIKKNLSFSINSNLASQLLNGYDYSVSSSGAGIRTLNSSFLTPLLWTFSGGFSLAWPMFGSLSVGFSSAKLTWIRDRSIFEKQKTEKFYGVPEGKNHLFEYGLSMQLMVDKDFCKKVKWNCDLLVFKNYNSPVDVSLKNNLGFRINNFLKAGIQTRVLYEEMISKSIQLENLVTFGVFVHL